MRQIHFLLLVLGVIFLVGCATTTPGTTHTLPSPPTTTGDGVWLEKQLTQCAEEWQEEVSQRDVEVLKVELTAFYKEKDISLKEIQYIELEPKIHCSACSCDSDVVMRLLVDEKDRPYFEEQGYTTLDKGNIPSDVIIVENVRDIETDHYTFESVELLENRILEVELTASGGCAHHDISLYAEEYFQESAPVQLSVKVIHEDNDDPCDSFITQKQKIHLSKIKELHSQYYHTEDTIILNILDAENNLYKEIYLEHLVPQPVVQDPQ